MKALVALALLCVVPGPVPAAGTSDGKTLFTKEAAPPCATCHTLKDAATTGAIGPVLDALKPDAARVAAALRNGIGVMPSYRDTLTDVQIAALADYVSTASGTPK